MTDSPEVLAAELAALVERVSQIASGGDAIDQLARLELLRSEDAALVGGRDASTLARWAAAAEDEGEPIAIKVGTSWLFVTSRLLDYIERASGLYGRREAETRLRKLIETRAGGQNPNQAARPRARQISNCG
ncbi:MULTISPECIES: hypothetical protein [unclassified Bradyrhizobium]|uniref:hypothetical protein n=1 Tax=unclassified Bradyrhizobium TaxID=2631580 RepID=UPI00247851DD|nr:MULTISPECIES: hypothetical protein [unclassified Bradyrhizobium]WGR70193.1 hypothetical protein MTX24_33120 [Bradyrhizobium sp. ISRA426]WGR82250.1 hypothetical protein MTX21_18225 [Bradyrhizobium sp. ISRA430]WGR85436.1 hypothetical protein MTX25_32795 [Bradyrhizobium sp. ISRA432]